MKGIPVLLRECFDSIPLLLRKTPNPAPHEVVFWRARTYQKSEPHFQLKCHVTEYSP